MSQLRRDAVAAPAPRQLADWQKFYPAWQDMTEPCRFPYFPQVDDVVMYFRQGHERYLLQVEHTELYSIHPKMWPRRDFDAEEFAVVTQVYFEMEPFRLCVLSLSRLHYKTQRPTGEHFIVKYHELAGVPDFVILKQHYDLSIRHKYRPGEHVAAVIDDKWWHGRVDRRDPVDPEFPRSNWMCLSIRWDNGEEERMSPWDLELVTGDSRRPRSATITAVERRRLAHYEPTEADWPEGAESTVRRISAAVNTLSHRSAFAAFHYPVDLEVYPLYGAEIAYRTDFDKIQKRLANGFYRRKSAILWEVEQLMRNACAFNEFESKIARDARVLYETLYMFSERANVQRDVVDVLSCVSRTDDASLEHCRRALGRRERMERGADARTAMAAREAARRAEHGWRVDCVDIMNNILADRSSSDFQNPGNQDLTAVFASGATDLRSIREKLEAEVYDSPIELQADVVQFLNAVKEVHDDKRSMYYKRALQISGLFTKAIQPVLERWRRCRGSATTGANPANVRNQQSTSGVRHTRRVSPSPPGPSGLRSTRSATAGGSSGGAAASTSSSGGRPRPQLRAQLQPLHPADTPHSSRQLRSRAIHDDSETGESADTDVQDDSSVAEVIEVSAPRHSSRLRRSAASAATNRTRGNSEDPAARQNHDESARSRRKRRIVSDEESGDENRPTLRRPRRIAAVGASVREPENSGESDDDDDADEDEEDEEEALAIAAASQRSRRRHGGSLDWRRSRDSERHRNLVSSRGRPVKVRKYNEQEDLESD